MSVELILWYFYLYEVGLGLGAQLLEVIFTSGLWMGFWLSLKGSSSTVETDYGCLSCGSRQHNVGHFCAYELAWMLSPLFQENFPQLSLNFVPSLSSSDCSDVSFSSFVIPLCTENITQSMVGSKGS